MEEQRRYEIAFSMIPNLKPTDARKLLEKVGSAETIIKDKLFHSIGNIPTDKLLKRADEEIEYCLKYTIKIRFLSDPDYPYRLSACEDAPLILYGKGDSNLNAKQMLAVVGTRRSTPRGRENTEVLIRDLAVLCPDIIIVSGLAYGIDITAHRASIEKKLNTVAVLAHGFQQLYPPAHRQTALEIIRNGSLLTELPSGTPSEGWRFIQRNRIVAGLCDACVVMESAEKGGSLHTAEMAVDYGREVFAYPGRPTDTSSQGCNLLIKNQSAALIEEAEDILKAMNWLPAKRKKIIQQKLFSDIPQNQQALFDLINTDDSISLTELSERSGFGISEILSSVMQLELMGLIQSLPGNLYSRKTI